MTFNELMMSLEIGLIYGIIAIGVYLTFRVIDFPDLTCDGSFVLGSVVVAVMVKSGINPLVSFLVAMISGGIAGYITGVLYTKFGVTNLLAGILTSFMLYSVNLRIMGMVPNITIIGNSIIFSKYPIIGLIIIGMVICTVVTYILMTDFGLALRSIGINKRLAQQAGVNVSLITIIGLAASNSIIALGGALFSLHQGFADVGSGIGTVIVGLASIIIGEKIMSTRSILIQVISCLVGSMIYRLLISLALHSDSIGMATSDLNLLTGILIVCIMYIPRRQPC